ncbi:MAG: ATP-binding domain-containing protein [Nitrosomonas sp.]|uniref:ATP-binding domain-containing protein n=1 Tax=Nitrosomonas sp. TaxID=42353 RepID=UPI001D999AFE|nr:ATP-binding domain-containing protein [Nitrosomonas sp.]MBX9894006.1 ATP-binding domain-containing protein [Nitrosomonas sp.]
MNLPQQSKHYVEQIAKDALDQFEKVSTAAKTAIFNALNLGTDALAAVNTMTDGSALQRLGQISQANLESYQILAREPAIARVAVLDEDGRQRVYYICRTTPITGVSNLASYRAPVGRLASLPVGTEFSIPNVGIVEVVGRTQLRPSHLAEGWDSRDTIIEADDLGSFTIESLRSLLYKAAGEEVTEDRLKQLLAEESETANIIEGVRRSVITKMGLRDQPILDQYQDEIFRLPLDQRLLILGPPGTGKTTTLIRRLGQKLDIAFLEEEELRTVESVTSATGGSHANSWVMFTPTELLKQYLKEAFAREGVPAPDMRIRTWADYRRELGRSTFGVLRTASGGGAFVLKEAAETLLPEASDTPIKWFEDFDAWQKTTFINDLRQAAAGLSENSSSNIASVGRRLVETLDRANTNNLATTFSALIGEVSGIQSLVTGLKEATDEKIKGVLNLQLSRDMGFIDSLAKFIDGLQKAPDIDAEDPDDLDADEEEATSPRTGRTATVTTYMQAVRAQARTQARKRPLGKNTRNGKIIEWLGDRGLGESDRAEVGASLLIQASARRFTNPVKRYLDAIPRRYRAYRRLRQEEGRWYRKDGFNPTDLHPLELDAILLGILRGANELLSRATIVRDIDLPVWSSLKPVLDLHKNQVVVDEATDFSPIQLACMAALANPKIQSFFACGDFNQRLTTWGSRSIDDVKWVFPEIDIKEITVSYRQSRKLNDLARAIIVATSGTDSDVMLPAHVDNEGVPPTLLENAPEQTEVVDWMAQRIREIEQFLEQMPSIAVFVESEAEVQPLADALNKALAAENAQVVACPKGQVMGQDNDVRVFDVQHIKGLEFEAVFFVGVDRLASIHPQLFDKYLYVGTTRAATYLGWTCDQAIPEKIASLRPMFKMNWQQ